MAWEGFRQALYEDPAGVETVLAVKIKATAQRAAAKPSVATELAWVIEKESAWRPDIRHPTSKTKATGLIQFTEATAKQLGTTVDDLIKMSRFQQAQYVQKFFDLVNKTAVAFGDVYLMTFSPSAVGKPNEYVIYAPGTAGWKENPGLRESPEGPITAGRVRQLGTPPTDELPGPGPGPGPIVPVPPKPKPKPKAGSSSGGFMWVLAALALYEFGFRKKRRSRRARR